MDKIQITKKITSNIVGYSASFTVARTLATVAPVNKPHHKAAVFITAFVGGWYISEKLEDFTDAKIDEIVQMVNDIKNPPVPTEAE